MSIEHDESLLARFEPVEMKPARLAWAYALLDGSASIADDGEEDDYEPDDPDLLPVDRRPS